MKVSWSVVIGFAVVPLVGAAAGEMRVSDKKRYFAWPLMHYFSHAGNIAILAQHQAGWQRGCRGGDFGIRAPR
jgi:hypothetical protein